MDEPVSVAGNHVIIPSTSATMNTKHPHLAQRSCATTCVQSSTEAQSTGSYVTKLVHLDFI